MGCKPCQERKRMKAFVPPTINKRVNPRQPRAGTRRDRWLLNSMRGHTEAGQEQDK